jgi:hypothetical protein
MAPDCQDLTILHAKGFRLAAYALRRGHGGIAIRALHPDDGNVR